MPIRPVAIAVRAAWFLAAILLAVVATGLQLDRQSRHNGELAARVPPVFRGQALQVLAQNAYRDGRAQQGLDYARELVRRRPIPAEGLALLTSGLIATGDQDGALSALSLASQRGWRDIFTQKLMAASALQVGEAQVAAQRLLALWRLGNRDSETKSMTLQLLNSADGRRNFAANLVGSDAWATDFLLWSASDGLPLRSWAALGKAFDQSKTKLDCGRLASPIRGWAMTGQSTGAIASWSDLCSHGRATSADQFSFTPPSDTPGPFDWNYPTQVGLDTSVAQDAGGASLRYDYSEYVSTPLAIRPAALKPGVKTARLDIETDDATQKGSVVLQVTCFSTGNQARRVAETWFDAGRATFEIPASGCAGQELALIVGHGQGTLRKLEVRDVSR